MTKNVSAWFKTINPHPWDTYLKELKEGEIVKVK